MDVPCVRYPVEGVQFHLVGAGVDGTEDSQVLLCGSRPRPRGRQSRLRNHAVANTLVRDVRYPQIVAVGHQFFPSGRMDVQGLDVEAVERARIGFVPRGADVAIWVRIWSAPTGVTELSVITVIRVAQLMTPVPIGVGVIGVPGGTPVWPPCRSGCFCAGNAVGRSAHPARTARWERPPVAVVHQAVVAGVGVFATPQDTTVVIPLQVVVDLV